MELVATCRDAQPWVTLKVGPKRECGCCCAVLATQVKTQMNTKNIGGKTTCLLLAVAIVQFHSMRGEDPNELPKHRWQNNVPPAGGCCCAIRARKVYNCAKMYPTQAVAVVQRSMRGEDPAQLMQSLGFGPLLLISNFVVKMSGVAPHQGVNSLLRCEMWLLVQVSAHC
eukprot:1114757-Pelagomonas_calceolata.AAC.5